ncbi:uncharacterized protein LOC122320095 [Drosophila ficusphila]|uniref:uncharacterized protein LOC122320095 n=1 Tax=Drosophila ficusphila TaxID=30025 RepID=UPI001C8A148E|nr:uncharacterized protein LOC122320095 [Drosophila ficusphila]
MPPPGKSANGSRPTLAYATSPPPKALATGDYAREGPPVKLTTTEQFTVAPPAPSEEVNAARTLLFEEPPLSEYASTPPLKCVETKLLPEDRAVASATHALARPTKSQQTAERFTALEEPESVLARLFADPTSEEVDPAPPAYIQQELNALTTKATYTCSSRSGQHLHCFIFLQKTAVRLIVATGASVSLLNRGDFQKRLTSTPCHVVLQGPSAEQFIATARVLASLVIVGRPLQHEFLLVEGNTPSLMGIDFMLRQQASVDLKALHLKFPRHQNSALQQHLSESQLPITGYMSRGSLGGCAFSQLPTEVILGSTVVNNTENSTILHLLNSSSRECRLPNFTILGQVEPAEVLPVAPKSLKPDSTNWTSLALPPELPTNLHVDWQRLLQRYELVFAQRDDDMGRTNLAHHTIDTGQARPIKQPPRRVPLSRKSEPMGIARSPSSKKKDGYTIFCVDYRRLNDVTKSTLVYLHDIIVHSRTAEEHLVHLDQVFDRLATAGLKLSPRKCAFFRPEVNYLGHIVSHNGLKACPEKIQKVVDWPSPRNQKEVRSFVGLCSYYRKFIPDFATIARPLHQLTKARRPFTWSTEAQDAFGLLKVKLTTSPVLTFPDPDGLFILDTDASNHGAGAVLSQCQEGQERVLEYYSKTFNAAERNYCVTRRELLAAVLSTKHFHHYLYG